MGSKLNDIYHLTQGGNIKKWHLILETGIS
jgi:hypothetical protein